ncbi:uncharacterized protein EV420DRAFT_1568429 [Desarmillaria tabescens]|uniref:Golgi apparatus membrane protein TVP38 n=1 Tax=Armillaria tabescens TaxID=1929756 RepID=A0AA39MUS1_ARMTA|nr:uncharacterized protein EV420DRAFT_1568429 [Desarmillaria tabescens]KAK0447377.1 hypothetical protein EV420DRAFT_1568429 [Desarmillaria tabescens]
MQWRFKERSTASPNAPGGRNNAQHPWQRTSASQIGVHMDPFNNSARYDDDPRHRHSPETWNNSPAPSPRPYKSSALSQASYTSVNTSVTDDIPNDGNKVPRDITRTPSPTPSELQAGNFNREAMKNWRFWIRREWLWHYVIFSIILVLSILLAVFDQQIIDWLTPFTRWLHDLKFGWLVPIAILFVISFPPLFGQEIVGILCGLVWGLGIGIGIVAAGTLLGEVANFYAFKYCCRARGEKLERTNITYACLAKVIRDGGFKIALIARLSAIPPHFTTAIFSTCGMGIIVFCLAAILTLPKSFINVYLGVILEQSATGGSNTKSKIITYVVLVVSTLITIVAMRYILLQMKEVKPKVIYARRKARQAKLARADMPYDRSDVFDASTSDVNIPLTLAVPGEAERGELYPFSPSYQYGSHTNAKPAGVVYAPTPKYVDDASSSRHSSQDHIMARPSVDEASWDTGRYGPTLPLNTPQHHRSSPQIVPQEVHLPVSSPRLLSPHDVRHGGEPTEASYHTAAGKEALETSTVTDIPGHRFDASRVRSPRPPNYATTAR